MTETLTDALDRFAAAGYRDDFRATSRGLRARLAGTVHLPETMIIEDLVRFEGETDPNEEAVVFALRSEKDGTRGTYTVAYGPGMDLDDIRIVERLQMKKR